MSRQQCTRLNNLLNEDVLAVTEELVFVSLQKQEKTSGLVMHVVLRLRQSFTQLTCSYDAKNQTLLCDLGNPMKSGTSVRTEHVLSATWLWILVLWIELFHFYHAVVMGGPSVHCSQTEGHLQRCDVWAQDTKVGSFHQSNSMFFSFLSCRYSSQWNPEPTFFRCSKNANNSESEVVLHQLEVAAVARAILQGWGCISKPLTKPMSCCNLGLPVSVFHIQTKSSSPLLTGASVRVCGRSRTSAPRSSTSSG